MAVAPVTGEGDRQIAPGDTERIGPCGHSPTRRSYRRLRGSGSSAGTGATGTGHRAAGAGAPAGRGTPPLPRIPIAPLDHNMWWCYPWDATRCSGWRGKRRGQPGRGCGNRPGRPEIPAFPALIVPWKWTRRKRDSGGAGLTGRRARWGTEDGHAGARRGSAGRAPAMRTALTERHHETRGGVGEIRSGGSGFVVSGRRSTHRRERRAGARGRPRRRAAGGSP